MTTFVALSDTHGYHWYLPPLPPGDVLLFAGDMTLNGTPTEVYDFNNWLGELDYEYKLITGGNHDLCLGYPQARNLITNGVLLLNEGVELDGLVIWMSPASRRPGHPAFAVDSRRAARRCWNRIPTDVDILVTHGPAAGILDGSFGELFFGESRGCPVLRERIGELEVPVHVHGHTHSQAGVVYREGGGASVNVCIASSDTDHETFEGQPWVFEI